MNARRTIESDHGTIDADMLAQLKQSFATSDLLAALDRLDACEGRQKWLRACLLRLHAMATHLIDGTPQCVIGQESNMAARGRDRRRARCLCHESLSRHQASRSAGATKA